MALTLNDIKPIGLCITTQELFDTKRFLHNYCDGLILRGKDTYLINDLTAFKRELNSIRAQLKFLNGYKAIITSNIDKILGIATSRYSKDEPRMVERLVMNGKDIIIKTLKANNFEEILAMENEFKSKITLPVYELFIKSLKKSDIKVI
jgi:calcineurin-like phosphoesterase family protein